MNPLKFAFVAVAATALSLSVAPVSAHDINQNDAITGDDVFKLGESGMEQLLKAVDGFGLDDKPVRESYVEVSAGGTIYQSMSLESFTNVPPSALYRAPVPFGVAYYSSQGTGIPPGQYLLRVQSDVLIKKPGMYPGNVSMVNTEGQIAAKFKVELDAFAMEPAPMGDWEGTVITPAIRYNDDMADGFRRPFVVVSTWCTNGLHIVDIDLTVRF